MEKEIHQDRILNHLTSLYGDTQAQETWNQLSSRLVSFREKNGAARESTPLDTLNNLDALLITYADQFQIPDQPHLTTLAAFIKKHLRGQVSGVHLLPFFPYSSDDGFSIINYKKVNPELGDWEDLQPLQDCCNLMFDAVINHISRESDWFKKYLQNQEPYTDYFLTVDPETDLSLVTRPRTRPLLTEVETSSGPAHVWTTFSPDQIDLNYSSPDLLLDILDVLLFYVQQGAKIIRLDAIAYLWKEIGTSCIHLPQTHQVIKLIRAVLDAVAPDVIIITETNVPHEANISYFGKQVGDEAQMVYQFPLAPLVLHTLRTGNASLLTNWASSIEIPFSSASFLNFIASHDGIGVRPAEGLLTPDEIQGLVDQTLDHNGQVSYKTNPDGSQSVYELNITLYDMLNDPGNTSLDTGVQRFMASQAIMLSLTGVPGIYIHSLFGAPNSHSEVAKTGRARSINREKYLVLDLEKELSNPASRTSKVFNAYTHYLGIRNNHPAFNPLAPQQILNMDPRVFALLRSSEDQNEQVLCIINISDKELELSVDPGITNSLAWFDLLTNQTYAPDRIALKPYQVVWLV